MIPKKIGISQWSKEDYIICIWSTLLAGATVIGNSTVILVIVRYRLMRQLNILLILSLSVADLLIGLVLVPVTGTTELENHLKLRKSNEAYSPRVENFAMNGVFRAVKCKMHLIVDVFLCTASIYNIVIIGMDRYLSLARPIAYKLLATRKKALFVVASVWLLAIAIALLGVVSMEPDNWWSQIDTIADDRRSGDWQHDNWLSNDTVSALNNVSRIRLINLDNITNWESIVMCRKTVSQNIFYNIFVSVVTFFVPMIILVMIYVRIFLISRNVINNFSRGMVKVKRKVKDDSSALAALSLETLPALHNFATIPSVTLGPHINAAARDLKQQLLHKRPEESLRMHSHRLSVCYQEKLLKKQTHRFGSALQSVDGKSGYFPTHVTKTHSVVEYVDRCNSSCINDIVFEAKTTPLNNDNSDSNNFHNNNKTTTKNCSANTHTDCHHGGINNEPLNNDEHNSSNKMIIKSKSSIIPRKLRMISHRYYSDSDAKESISSYDSTFLKVPISLKRFDKPNNNTSEGFSCSARDETDNPSKCHSVMMHVSPEEIDTFNEGTDQQCVGHRKTTSFSKHESELNYHVLKKRCVNIRTCESFNSPLMRRSPLFEQQTQARLRLQARNSNFLMPDLRNTRFSADVLPSNNRKSIDDTDIHSEMFSDTSNPFKKISDASTQISREKCGSDQDIELAVNNHRDRFSQCSDIETLNSKPTLHRRRLHKTRSVLKKGFVTKLKAFRMLAMVAGCFIFCWLGYAIISIVYKFLQNRSCSSSADIDIMESNQRNSSIVNNFVNNSFTDQQTCWNSCEAHNHSWDYLYRFFVWLSYVNSCINPVINSMLNKDIRNRLGQLFVKKSRREKAVSSGRCGQLNTVRSSTMYGWPI